MLISHFNDPNWPIAPDFCGSSVAEVSWYISYLMYTCSYTEGPKSPNDLAFSSIESL